MEVHEFIQKLEEVMGYKVKIKHAHTTKGDTWESTVKGKDEHEALAIIKDIDKQMREFFTVKVTIEPFKKEAKDA